MKIFISHSRGERELAVGLSKWIEKLSWKNKCFCSSRPSDLSPGHVWFDLIRKNAIDSDIALFMLSPDSVKREWIYYEAGLVAGIGKKQTIVIPVVYGGALLDNVSSMLRRNQTLDLAERDQFNQAVRLYFNPNKRITTDYYDDFVNSLNDAAKRIMRLGYFAGFEPFSYLADKGEKDFQQKIVTDRNETKNRDVQEFPRHTADGEIAGVRVWFTPRQLNETQHWKFGVGFRNGNEENEEFMFHASCEHRLSTWTLYTNNDRHGRTYLIPASLDWEVECSMSIWLRNGGSQMAVGAVDSNGELIRVPGRAGQGFWRVVNKKWDNMIIKAWADDKEYKYQIDANWEIDRVKAVKCCRTDGC